MALPLSLSIMFFGSVWREASLGGVTRQIRAYIGVWVALFLIFLPFICVLAYSADYGNNENPYAYFISYVAGMFLGMTMTRFLRRPTKSLIYLGTISYSTYLVHPFFLEWAAHATNLPADFNAGVFLIYILATLTLSSISYTLLEKPCVRLGMKINNRLRADRFNPMHAATEPSSKLK